jgi:hypothetical protein
MRRSHDDVDEELGRKMEYLGERLNRVFSYFFFQFEFEGDEDLRSDPSRNPRAWMLETIENACLDTTLLALRDLDDFLRPRLPNTKPDDLRASDFGYPGDHSFLTSTEREDINKRVAHTTTVGSASPSFRWDIVELETKGVSQALEFLRWVESEYAMSYFLLRTAALPVRTHTEGFHEAVTRASRKGNTY